jgi:hypothetical protein
MGQFFNLLKIMHIYVIQQFYCWWKLPIFLELPIIVGSSAGRTQGLTSQVVGSLCTIFFRVRAFLTAKP